MSRGLAAAALLLAAVSTRSDAAQPQFWRLESPRDFLEGETEDLAIDAEGGIRLAPKSRVIHDPQMPYVWSLASDGPSVVYAGTGNEGKVYRIQKDSVVEIFDAAELEVHALAIGPDGTLYAGTSPDGKVYRIDKEGKVETFFDPSEKYIWSLVFDPKGSLLVATGLPGRVYRVDSKGDAQVVLTTAETHIVSLAADGQGNIYAGSAPGAIVYRVDPAGRVFVLHDAPYREVKALGLGPDGSLYAALVDGMDKAETTPRPTVTFPPLASPGTIEIPGVEAVPPTQAAPGPVSIPVAPVPEAARQSAAKGAVIRVFRTGEVETVWTSGEDVPHALLVTEAGVLIGTGNKGKLYRISNDRTWSMVKALPAEQITALHSAGHGAVVAGVSNPGRVHQIDGGLADRGVFLSKPRDTETVSAWGRFRLDAEIPVGAAIEIQTRSGNTSTPDSTWSDWSKASAKLEGAAVESPRARFLQLRATLSASGKASSPVLHAVHTAFLQRNLRPQVTSITVHPPGEVFQKPLMVSGELEILGLDPADGAELRGAPSTRPPAATPTAFSRRMVQHGIQTFTWKAEDPNSDTLDYQVEYRRLGEAHFRTLKRGLNEAVLAWDTATVPNGRYVIKVIANDMPSNPPSLALTGDKQSDPFEIDNTPPSLTAVAHSKRPASIRASARDDMTPIKRADFAVDGGRWQEVHPLDGINDSLAEDYEIALPDLSPESHVVVVRVVDQLGNVATARVELP